jgi:two-component system, NarL family, nitrate/nitrite response regulator NarL
MKILIVDDNARMRKFIRTTLSASTAEFAECADGESAVTRCNSFHPDYVLMDLKMTLMDGIESTRLIKQTHPSTHVFMVTDHDDPALREKAAAAGVERYVLKEDLLTIRNLIPATPPGR